MTIRGAFALILAAVVIVFTMQNLEQVHVYFLLWELSMSRALMIFAIFLIGAGVGWLLRGMHRRR